MAGPMTRARGRLGGLVEWATDRPLSHATLIEFTRSVRFFLASGLSLRDAMRALAENGTWSASRQAAAIAKVLDAGYSFTDALDRRGRRFPPLFKAMAAVGDETGSLPEVMADLEKYYELQRQLGRQLRSQISWPVIQFVLAVCVVAVMIWVLGMIPQARQIPRMADPSAPDAVEQMKKQAAAPAIDPLGLGVGENGAILFLVIVFGLMASAVLLFLGVRRLLRRRAFVDRVLLLAPFFGPCLQAVALSRFCLAMRLMLNTNLSILSTVRLGYEATDNTAFVAAVPKSVGVLKRGNSLTTALTAARLFPRPYLSAVAIAEESGHLSEVMATQGEYYDEVARQRLALLTRLLGTMVWLAVAGFVIFLIFSIFTGAYTSTYNKYT